MRIIAEMTRASATLMVAFFFFLHLTLKLTQIQRFIPVEYLWVIPENHLSLRPQQVKEHL